MTGDEENDSDTGDVETSFGINIISSIIGGIDYLTGKKVAEAAKEIIYFWKLLHLMNVLTGKMLLGLNK